MMVFDRYDCLSSVKSGERECRGASVGASQTHLIVGNSCAKLQTVFERGREQTHTCRICHIVPDWDCGQHSNRQVNCHSREFLRRGEGGQSHMSGYRGDSGTV